MALRRWPSSRYPADCQGCQVKIPAASPRFEDKEAHVVLCETCGLAEVARASGTAGASPAPRPAPTPTPPPPVAPGPRAAPPAASGDASPAPAGSKRTEFDPSTLPRVALGLTIGLPGYCSAKLCIEATAEIGEGLEALRERLQRDVLAQLAEQVTIVLAASKDPSAFVREYGDPGRVAGAGIATS